MSPASPSRICALTCDVDPSAQLVRCVYYRQPEFAEWRGTMERVLAQAAFRPVNLLSDRRLLVEAASPAVIRQMADFVIRHRHTFDGGRWAVVVAPAHRAEYGMARMGSALFERAGVQLRPFTDYETAWNWVTGWRAETDW
ncbi:MAG TPA: hypothetical protein VF198_10285 [Vicinamibacterales bacterium]